MKGASLAQFEAALTELDAWAKRTGQKLPTLLEEHTFAETEIRAWLDGNEQPLDWTYSFGSPGYPGVTADEWFFITTLYGTMTLTAQRTHIRKFHPILFVEAAGRDVRNFHANLAAYAGLRQNWMKKRLIKMGEVLSSRGNTMTEYVEQLRELERTATPSNPMPARDKIFTDHQTSSGKTLSVFVRDCVLGNCFPIDSRVRIQLQAFGLPNNEENEEWLVRQCLATGRNPREVARLFYNSGGAVTLSSGNGGTDQAAATAIDVEAMERHGDEPPELTDEDESILDGIWAEIAAERKTAQISSSGKSDDGLFVFTDSDPAYLDWLRGHPEGYIVNAYRNKSPDYMVLHRATCGFVSKYAHDAKPGGFTEREFIKVCSVRISDLSAWTTHNGREDGSFTGKCSCRPFRT